MGVSSDSSPGFLGVGNQKFSSVLSGGSICIKAFTYATTSSCSVRSLSAALWTGRIDFVSSGFKICSSASLVCGLIV